jgi:hypothetical protein
MDEQEYEVFYDDLKDNSGVLRITIPDKIVQAKGWKAKDNMKVYIKKV